MLFKKALPRLIQIKQNLPLMSITAQALHPSNCRQPNTLRYHFQAMQRCKRIDNQSSAIQFYSLLIMGNFYHQLSSCVTGCWTQEHCHRKIRPHHINFTTHQGIIAVLKKVRYALCPMPYALCPMPMSTSSFARKAIINMYSILHPRFIFTKNSRAYNLWSRRPRKKLCTP